MSTAKKLNEAVAATPKDGDKLLMVQDGQIKAALVGSYNGYVPTIVAVPRTETLMANGFVHGEDKLNFQEVFAGILRYLYATYPSRTFFLATLTMSGLGGGFMIAYTSGDVVDGARKYVRGIATFLFGRLYYLEKDNAALSVKEVSVS